MFGRRPDATLVRDVSTVRRFMQYLSATRNEALVFYAQDLDVEPALAHLAERNAGRAREDRLTLFHLVLHAIGIAVHTRPKLNRFTAGGRLWQRDGVWLSFSAKRAFADDAPIVTVKRRFDPEASVEALADGLFPPLRAARAGEQSTSDREMALVLRLPGPLLRLALRAARGLDAWGLLPRSMIEADPLYTSVFVANLGSVGLDAGYHHLWEWGTCPAFCVIGRIRETESGRRVTLKWTYDERIADALYAASALELVRLNIENPTG